MYLTAIFFIGLIASIIGAICGIGGGVIIKPVIDIIGLTDVSSASFLSTCTVIMMTAYSVFRNKKSSAESRDKRLSDVSDSSGKIDLKNVVPLAVGAAMGGLIGKMIFETAKEMLSLSDRIGAYQSLILGAVAAGTLLYTKNKKKIKTKKLKNPAIILIFGLLLGCMSSFLGIGGGPVDLVVLYYFFSMETKSAVQNSLFIIFISQVFSLSYTIITSSVPDVSFQEVILMAAGGIAGGIIGRKINSKISSGVIEKLFIWVLACIILISIYNFFYYL